MPRSLHVALAAAACTAALLSACANQPNASDSPEVAQQQCRLFRGYLGTQSYSDVMASCTRQLGEAYCRQCLNQ